jgi:hypothetical protein
MVPGKDGRNKSGRMEMKRAVLVLPLLLAACNSSPSIKATNASVAEVTQKAQQTIRIEPGQWKGEVELSALKLPNLDQMPPEVRARMQTAMHHSFTNCVTPEQLADPKRGIFQPDAERSCVYDSFSMQDGKIESEMTCHHGATTQHSRMTGTFTATSYDVVGESDEVGGGSAGGGGKVHITAARTGACTGKENGS